MWQAARSLAASDMLGHQVLLHPGLVPALVALMRPPHLTALAGWHARLGPAAGPALNAAAVPVLVTGILHEGILHAHANALRDVYQVLLHLKVPCLNHRTALVVHSVNSLYLL